MPKCPDCGKRVRLFAFTCRHCGRKLQFHENGIIWAVSLAVTASTVAILAWLLYRIALTVQRLTVFGLVTIDLL